MNSCSPGLCPDVLPFPAMPALWHWQLLGGGLLGPPPCRGSEKLTGIPAVRAPSQAGSTLGQSGLGAQGEPRSPSCAENSLESCPSLMAANGGWWEIDIRLLSEHFLGFCPVQAQDEMVWSTALSRGGSYSAVHVPPSPALMVQRPVKLLLQAVVQFLPWGTQGQAPQGRAGH